MSKRQMYIKIERDIRILHLKDRNSDIQRRERVREIEIETERNKKSDMLTPF